MEQKLVTDLYEGGSWVPLGEGQWHKCNTGWTKLIRTWLIRSWHLIDFFKKKSFAKITIILYMKFTYRYFEFHVIRSKNLSTSDLELTCTKLYYKGLFVDLQYFSLGLQLMCYLNWTLNWMLTITQNSAI